MAKTLTADTSTSQDSTSKKQRKKLAKREAKLMLQIDQARKDVGKAEQKLAKAQSTLTQRATSLHDLEDKLNTVRMNFTQYSDHITSTVEYTNVGEADSTEDDAAAAIESPIEAMHLESMPPVEGRSDLTEPAAAPSTTESVATTGSPVDSTDTTEPGSQESNI